MDQLLGRGVGGPPVGPKDQLFPFFFFLKAPLKLANVLNLYGGMPDKKKDCKSSLLEPILNPTFRIYYSCFSSSSTKLWNLGQISKSCPNFGTGPKFWNVAQIMESRPNSGIPAKFWNVAQNLESLPNFRISQKMNSAKM